MLLTLRGTGDNRTERETSISALIERLQITSPVTPETISRVLDAYLLERGRLDFGRDFDMKSALTEVMAAFLEDAQCLLNEYEDIELAALVLWFFDAIFPSIDKMNEFAVKISKCAPVALGEVDCSESFGNKAVYSYVYHDDWRSFYWLKVAWLRYKLFLERSHLPGGPRKPGMALEFAIAELLTVDIYRAVRDSGNCSTGGQIKDVSDHESSGIPFANFKNDPTFLRHFKLLRDDLDALCPADFEIFSNKTIKASINALGAEDKNQPFWNNQYWYQDGLAPSQSEANVLQGLENLVEIPEERCVKFWKEKRLAVWKKLNNSFAHIIQHHAQNTGLISGHFGKGMVFLMSMTKFDGLRDIEWELLEELCKAFGNKIPELEMINDVIESSLNIPGLETEDTSAKIERLEEGMEHIRGFYVRLVNGRLRSEDLTPYSEPLYLDLEPARAAFDQRLVRSFKAMSTTPGDIASNSTKPKCSSNSGSASESSGSHAWQWLESHMKVEAE